MDKSWLPHLDITGIHPFKVVRWPKRSLWSFKFTFDCVQQQFWILNPNVLFWTEFCSSWHSYRTLLKNIFLDQRLLNACSRFFLLFPFHPFKSVQWWMTPLKKYWGTKVLKSVRTRKNNHRLKASLNLHSESLEYANSKIQWTQNLQCASNQSTLVQMLE